MKCPFELPVKADEELLMLHIDGKLRASMIIGNVDDWNDEKRLLYLRYIVTAINSHEKSRDIIFEVARQAIAKYDINAPPLTKNRFANEFVDSLDEALEAEKP